MAINLGTGTGSTVLEVLEAAQQTVGHDIAMRIGDRRPGDASACFADSSLAARLLDWRATRTLNEMCVDAWRWQSMNPDGYK